MGQSGVESSLSGSREGLLPAALPPCRPGLSSSRQRRRRGAGVQGLQSGRRGAKSTRGRVVSSRYSEATEVRVRR